MSLPEFKFTSEFNLSETLSGMGMPAPFDPGLADFSGMDGQRDLYISDVLHQAFLSVDETGTEAAAASAVAMREAGIAQVDATLVIDRPFIFIIRDLPSSQILCAGRLLDPES
jgi:serpin B